MYRTLKITTSILSVRWDFMKCQLLLRHSILSYFGLQEGKLPLLQMANQNLVGTITKLSVRNTPAKEGLENCVDFYEQHEPIGLGFLLCFDVFDKGSNRFLTSMRA